MFGLLSTAILLVHANQPRSSSLSLSSLIPNLSYVSEAAAYTLDCQLQTHIVPYTDVVYLSSKSFHYPFWDRRAFRKNNKALPAKPGSFQVFLKGFRDANVFLREHPWPSDQHWLGMRTDPRRRRNKHWADSCRPSTAASRDEYSDDDDDGSGSGSGSGNGNGNANGNGNDNGAEPLQQQRAPGPDNFVWTETLKQSFREQLEKLVILDYIMRNTDRGLDNWMIKVDWKTEQATVVSEPIRMATTSLDPDEEAEEENEEDEERGPRLVNVGRMAAPRPTASLPYPYRVQQPMQASTSPNAGRGPTISVGAIDNSLSWPWKHPDAWRRWAAVFLFYLFFPLSPPLLTHANKPHPILPASRSDGSSSPSTSSAAPFPKRPVTTSCPC